MNKIVFANQAELACLLVEEGPEFYDNANRRVLTVQAAKSAAGLDELDTLLGSAANLTKLRHVNTENGAEDIFDNYQIKMELSARPVSVGQAEDGQVLTEDRIVFKLGRLTPIELKLAQLGL